MNKRIAFVLAAATGLAACGVSTPSQPDPAPKPKPAHCDNGGPCKGDEKPR